MKRKRTDKRYIWLIAGVSAIIAAAVLITVICLLPDGGDTPPEGSTGTVITESTDVSEATEHGTDVLTDTVSAETAPEDTANAVYTDVPDVTATVAAQDPSEDQPSDDDTYDDYYFPTDRLPNMPRELWNNVFLFSKNNGVCEALTGDVLITVVAVDDPAGTWTDENIAEQKKLYEAQARVLESEASRYGVQLDISFNYLRGSVDTSFDRDNYGKWRNNALRSAGLSLIGAPSNNLKKQYGVDEAPVILAMSYEGRAFADRGQGMMAEYVYLYNSGESLAHELLHIYGAEDYYYPDEVTALAEKYFPGSIMQDSDNTKVDSLTAYLVGWTDNISTEADSFIRETMELTSEYISSERAKETLTGYGTKEDSDGVYTGDLVAGIRHGKGKMVWKSGNSYEGEWVNGKMHGKGLYLKSNGDSYNGDWVENKITGYGIYSFAGGDVYEGEFVDAETHGYGKYKFASGAVYEGQSVHGERHGYGKYTFADGTVYEGDFAHDKICGKGKMTYTVGDVYEGEFADDTKNGYGVYRYSVGAVYEGYWLNGNKHGQGKMTHPDGTVTEGLWENNDFIG